MTKSSTTDANQMCLPLEEFLNREAARRAPNRDARQLGECIPSAIRDVIERAGRPDHDEGSGGDDRIGPTDRSGGGKAIRSEIEWEATPCTRPSLASGEDELPAAKVTGARTGLTPRGAFDHEIPRAAGRAVMKPGPVFVVVCVLEAEHGYAGSETWIEF